IAAVEANPEVLQYMVTAFKKRRGLVVDLIRKIPHLNINIPEGAFYDFPDVTYYFGKAPIGVMISNTTDFTMCLLEKAYVAVVTGEAFGNPDCIRLSYATSDEQLTEAFERIRKALVIS